MTAYINKGKRNFIIKKGDEAFVLAPFQIIELTEKEYQPLKNFKDIVALEESKKAKENEHEKIKQENKKTNGNNK